ncbi:ABC transporter substrate-binding protein [Paraburkholderia sp. HD33-4]|uniref:ABC transporter substrate-binding protein n=1 Tax=Paraburkholderia sp. HD33-4 TaxID=2883242 RepID=UPI001F284467|nr:ABC transporter substrate-binding protein [Paraburkholderia sp. HD33-4]
MSPDNVFATSDEACELTPTGQLRAAINFGNPIFANRDPKTGEPNGVCVDLATRLAALIDAPVQLVLYDAAGEVVAGCERGEWDVAFVARDPVRGKGIEQTRPYLLIEGAHLVPENSPIRRNEDVDRTGTRVVVGKGSAYDLYLSRTLQKAAIVRSPTSPAVVETMVSEGYEVAAGVRQQLEYDATHLSGLRLLPERFMVIEQAMGTPKGRDAAAHLLDRFVTHMVECGFVKSSLEAHGIRGACVAPVG